MTRLSIAALLVSVPAVSLGVMAEPTAVAPTLGEAALLGLAAALPLIGAWRLRRRISRR